MPYYVYAIHTDDTDNRLYYKYDDDGFQEAQEKEKWLQGGNYPGDNYFVRMFYAANDADAKIKADKLRPKPKLSN